MTHASIVKIDQMVNTFHLVVLRFMVEPTRTNRRVALGRHPLVAIGMALLQLPILRIAGINFFTAQKRPVSSKSIATLIAHPSAAGAAIAEYNGIGLELINHGPCPREVIIGRSEERRVGKECRSRWSPY